MGSFAAIWSQTRALSLYVGRSGRVASETCLSGLGCLREEWMDGIGDERSEVD